MQTLLILLNILSSYQLVWKNTEFEIPLGADVYEHFEIPEVEVYQNGSLVNTEINYQRGVNHTSLRVVNSNHVKSFKIDYKAYIDDLGLQSIQTITFNIVDEIKPTFLYLPELSFPVKTKKLTEKEIMEQLIYEDNYYNTEDLIVKVHGLEGVNINIPGEYLITYELIDPSFNITKVNSKYKVVNNLPPEIIEKSKTHIINVYDNFRVNDYFTFVDPFNQQLTIEVDDSLLNTNKVGSYSIHIKVINNLGLSNEGHYDILVVDNKSPTITLSTKREFNYLETFDLRDLVISVNDNYDKLTKDDVEILGYIDFFSLGEYPLTFKVKDSSGNESKPYEIKVKVIDLEKPKIDLIKPIKVNVGQEVTNFDSYFEFSDNYDSYEFGELIIKYNTKEINFKELGNYILNVELSDSSKNRVSQNFEVLVTDLISPEILINYDNFIFIDQYGELSNNYFKKEFIISDNYDNLNDIEILINETINFYESAEIIRNFIFKDKSGNETIIENVKIVITESRPPDIVLEDSKYIYYIGNEKPDLKSLVKSVTNFDGNTEGIILEYYENINYEKVGMYLVTYQAYHEKINNVAVEELKFYVDSKKSFDTIVNDLEISVGDNVEELAGIIINSDIKYEVFPKTINTGTPGIKKRIFILYDKRGNIETIEQTIVVLEKTSKKNYKTNIIISGIALIGGGIYLNLSKRKNKLFW